MGTFSVEAVVRVGRVVDNVELAGLVVVSVPPVHHSGLVPLLVSELSVVAEKGTRLEQFHYWPHSSLLGQSLKFQQR